MSDWAAIIIASIISGALGFLRSFLAKTYQVKKTSNIKQKQKNYYGSNGTQIGNIPLTNVGIAIAIANIQNKLGFEIDMSIWIN